LPVVPFSYGPAKITHRQAGEHSTGHECHALRERRFGFTERRKMKHSGFLGFVLVERSCSEEFTVAGYDIALFGAALGAHQVDRIFEFQGV
jgi:hypothetical protein